MCWRKGWGLGNQVVKDKTETRLEAESKESFLFYEMDTKQKIAMLTCKIKWTISLLFYIILTNITEDYRKSTFTYPTIYL